MKNILILFTLVFLGSCGVDVNSNHVKLGEEVCKDSEGLHHLDTSFFIMAVCNHTKESKPRLRDIGQ